MAQKKLINLTAKQSQFFVLENKFALFSGGYGNGKTTVLVCWAREMARKYPGSTGVLCRLTYPDLRDTLRTEWYKIVPKSLISRRNDTENICTLNNGSSILFRRLDAKMDDRERSNLLSSSFDWAVIDQSEEIGDEEFKMLRGRLRGAVGPRQIRLGCNPEGHNWLWHYFKSQDILADSEKTDYGLTEATSLDNEHLPHDYVADIQRYPERWKKRYVYGSWDDFSGMVWPEWNPAIHLIDQFEIPSHWKKLRGIDPATSGITACLWTAFSPRGDCVVYREYYESDLRVEDHAAAILRLSVGDGKYYIEYMDPSAWKRNREGISDSGKSQITTFHDEYSRYGFYPIPADNNMNSGINRVGQMLTVRDQRVNPFTKENKSPSLFVMKNCVNYVEEIGSYTLKRLKRFSDNTDGKPDPKCKDHLMDLTRYQALAYNDSTADEMFVFPERKSEDANWGSGKKVFNGVNSWMGA